MKVLFGFLFVFVTIVRADMAGECDMAGLYLELGCDPGPINNKTNCPDYFTCPDLHPDPMLCYYRGVPYKNRASIPQSLVNNPCSQSCVCTTSSEPRFECAATDCVETFDNDIKTQCIYTYELDSCCYTGTVCGKDEIAKLKTCEIDGETYKEGQSFEPKNTRKTCICTAQWDGSVDNPAYCRDINCGVEIHFQDKILDNCAPVFVVNSRSCPITFQCLPFPLTFVITSDQRQNGGNQIASLWLGLSSVQRTCIIRASPTSKIITGASSTDVSKQCIFGNVTLNVGDEVTVDEKCTTCLCQVPPFVMCNQQSACDK